ncbi:conserved hypothetical protein [Rubrivivax sp. A210]|uniref:hypothetical protein n=1 Tax=Rubrivivax sp. A210 TaxID=2772301 RepID=UPI001919B660|nr:hypothetical protein [Rubrivivax sp. A210]CAD5374342.1 conserved hypothetical protein [Rubrivivax sp. A210]
MRDFDDTTLWRISAFERMQAETGSSGFARLGARTQLPSTMQAELTHLRRAQRSADVLEVVGLCVRQRESALVLLRHRGLVWPLTVFPEQGLYHLPRPIIASLQQGNLDLQVVGVEAPGLRPPGHVMSERIGDKDLYHPLAPLLAALAQFVPRAQLLEEIGGRAAYRLAAGFAPDSGESAGALGPALRRLRKEIASLAEIASWPGMDRERATRLLNSIYLQGGLMVLRAHHAARDETTRGERLRNWLRLAR